MSLHRGPATDDRRTRSGGRTGGLAPGVGVAFKLSGADTGGALAVVEHPLRDWCVGPPHLHTREDEYSIVLG